MTATLSARPEPTPAAGELSHRQIITILSGLLMGMFLASLDQTIVATAMKTIANDLDGLSAQAWVTTAYLITSTISTPIYGKLGDLFGRKKLFLFAITVFLIGSLMCTFAQSMYMLAAFRAFQGIGAGGLFSLALAIIGDLVPPRERARYTGYFMAVFGTSSVLGPVVGGLFAQTSSILWISGWRWVFLVNIPIGVVALFVVSATLRLHSTRRQARIDWWGAATMVVGVVPLLIVAEQGRTWGWASRDSILCFVVGGVGLVAFVIAEARMGDNALIPLRLFRSRAMAVTIVASIIVGAGMFGGITVLPLYMQIVHDASPISSGLMMLPMVVGMMGAGVVSGQITSRTGRIRMFPIIGTILATVALALLWRITADTHLIWVMLFMLILGYGLGNCMQPLTMIAQNAVGPRDIGVATSSATFFRQIGGTLGVAVFLSILFNNLPGKINDAFAAAVKTPAFQQAMQTPTNNPYDKQLIGFLASGGTGPNPLAQISNDSSIISRFSPVFAHPIKVGFAQSMDLIFLCAAIVMAIAVIVLLFMPHVELRRASAAVLARQGADKEADAGDTATTAPVAGGQTGSDGPGAGVDQSPAAGRPGEAEPVSEIPVARPVAMADAAGLATGAPVPDGAVLGRVGPRPEPDQASHRDGSAVATDGIGSEAGTVSANGTQGYGISGGVVNAPAATGAASDGALTNGHQQGTSANGDGVGSDASGASHAGGTAPVLPRHAADEPAPAHSDTTPRHASS